MKTFPTTKAKKTTAWVRIVFESETNPITCNVLAKTAR